MMQIQNKQVPFASIIAFAYLLLPFLQKTALVLLLCITPFLVLQYIKRNDAIFLTVLLAALITYLWLGAEENRPVPQDLMAVLSHLVSSIVVILPLFLVSRSDAKKAIEYLCLGVVSLVFIQGILTFVFEPGEVIQRYMIYPISGDEIASTGQINSMATAVGFLLLLSGRKYLGIIALFLLIAISLIYANRTDMIISAIYFFILFLQALKSSRISHKLIAIPLVLISAYLLFQPGLIPEEFKAGFSRFTSEGLETERTDTFAIGLKAILSGEYPLGGAQLGYEWSYPWYHNLFLDAYRVAGIPAMALFLLLTSISFHAAWKSKSKGLIIVWLVAFSMTMTSVPIEGTFIEYTIYFAIYSYALIAKGAQMYVQPVAFMRQQNKSIKRLL